MVSTSVRRVAAAMSFAALALIFAGSPAHAQCQGGGQGGGQGGNQGGGGSRGGGSMSGGSMGMSRGGSGGMTGGRSMQRGTGSQLNSAQQSAMIAALQQQQVAVVQLALIQQQVNLQSSLQQIAAKIDEIEQTDDSDRAQVRLNWLRQRQAILQRAAQQRR